MPPQEVDQALWPSHWQPLLQQQLGLTGRFLPRGGYGTAAAAAGSGAAAAAAAGGGGVGVGGATATAGVSREGVALLWSDARFKLLSAKNVVFREMLPRHTMPGEGEWWWWWWGGGEVAEG